MMCAFFGSTESRTTKAPAMPFAIELHFDQTSTARISTLWTELQRISGKPLCSELGVRPHISVAVLAEPPKRLEFRLREYAAILRAFDLELSGIDTFPGDEGVVFVRASLSRPLREIHAGISQVLADLGVVNSPLYESSRWIPHCTLATDVPAGSIQRIMNTAANAGLPAIVRATALCGVRYRPARLDFQIALKE